MRLRTLIILNFKAYVGEHVIPLDNPPGLYYVRGVNRVQPDLESNGAAKSTIFDALSWCLYGKTLRDERPGATIEPWSGETPTRVELTFDQEDGKTYRIARGRHPNTLGWSLSDDDLHLLSNDDLQECDQVRIAELFPLSYEAFVCTIVLPQFGRLFLDLRPEEQSRLFTEMLELDKWITGSETASKLATMAKADLDEMERKQSELDGRIAEMIAASDREQAAVQTFEDEKRAEIAEKKQALDEVVWELSTLHAIQRPSNAKAVRLSKEISDLARVVRDLDQQARRAEIAANKAGTLYDSLVHELELYKDDQVCPECGQKVSKKHRDEKVEALRLRISDANDDAVKAVKEQRKLAARYAGQNTMLEQKRQQEQKETEIYRADLAAYQRRESYVSHKKSVRDRLKADIAKIKARKNTHQQTMLQLEQRIAEADHEATALAQARDVTDYSIQAYALWVEGFKRIRLNLIDDVLGAVSNAATASAAELGLHGWAVQMSTERENASGKLARGFACMLYPPGAQEPIKWESYCGGEVQRWQLAVRFALSELVLDYAGVSTNIEILDEPTEHMSPGGVEMLLKRLRDRAQRLGRQIWLVDHHVFDTSLFDGSFLVENDLGGARVSRE